MPVMWRPCWVLALALLLVSCAGQQSRMRSLSLALGTTDFHDDISLPQQRRYCQRRDSVPAGAPPAFITSLPEPVPKVEPRSRHGNKSPYVVCGKRYVVLHSAKGYDERGMASYYGTKFQHYKTSNMETYDMYKFTAASRVLPLPSYVRVTNLNNGKSVVVRVNDRGPFHGHRLIDISYAAAVRIGLWPHGVGRVEVRGLDPFVSVARHRRAAVSSGHHHTSRHVVTREKPPLRSRLFLQVGAFSALVDARRMAERLRREHLGPVLVADVIIAGRHVHRVRLGPLKSHVALSRLRERIVRLGLSRPYVAVE